MRNLWRCLGKHHDPLWLVIRVRQAVYTTSTTGTSNACFFLLRTFACKVTDLATVMASTFLLGVTILGFCAFPLAFLAFLSFPTPFVAALMPTILREVALLPAHVTDSILREYAQIHWRWTWPGRPCHGHFSYFSCHQCVRVAHSRVQEQMFTQRGIWQVM